MAASEVCARKGFKGYKAFCPLGGKRVADALALPTQFLPFRLFGHFAVFAAIAYFEMNNYLCKIEYYGRSTVVYFSVYK